MAETEAPEVAVAPTAPPAQGGELVKEHPGMLTRLYYATTMFSVQTFSKPGAWYKSWLDWFSPPDTRPDLVKRYDSRAQLPIRIFFPASYDQTSPQTLPTLFTIHGGGFCLGAAEDDDRWNRQFADLHRVLVIALNYAKAPWSPFPGPLHDVEALFLAALADESLPIDKARVGVAGFSAGGNLSLGLCQLPSVKGLASGSPKAVVPIYPPLDFTVTPISKRNGRPWKKGMFSGIRGQERDYVMEFADVFDWAYVPYGTNMRDPLLCPIFSKREDLPPHVFIIAAELDFLCFEDNKLACALAGRPQPSSTMAGRQEKARTQELELRDERFHWESPETGVRWLLVPDVIHAFDLHVASEMFNDAEGIRDGEAKAVKYMKLLGEWLHKTAWR